MICSKPFSTFADKFVKPSNHEEGLWAILVFFFCPDSEMEMYYISLSNTL